MVKAVIFDADHTLYTPRTERAYEEKFAYLGNRLGIDSDRLREIWRKQVDKAINADDYRKRARDVVLEKTLMELELSIEEREDLVDHALERFWEQVVDDLEYDPAVERVLENLQRYGVELVAVASDEFRQPLERKLDHVLGNWQDYFETLVTPERAGSMKPSTQFYTAILDREGLEPEEVVVVGDSWERDLEPAARLGIKTVLLADTAKGEPDFHIETIERLEDIVKKL
ncbi:MAG: HAD family hydrolase [Candidatus Nanohaloarchaea archaeon]|nr:HAD family hydrolase [Candidatus Nanohaloarchaea archaeon]